MRIALIAPLFESVPPKLYGGTERVVDWLCRGLVAAGMDVTLLASADSTPPPGARLVPITPEALRLRSRPAEDPAAYTLRLLAVAAEIASDFDIIHNHADTALLPLCRMTDRPVLSTLHGRLDLPDLPVALSGFSDQPFVSISDSQRGPLHWLRWSRTVHHGLPLNIHDYQERHGNYLAFLGRIFPEKGPDTAIQIALKAGVPLKIAAKIEGPQSKQYFDHEIKPWIDGRNIEFIGEISDQEKSSFLGNALALCFPIRWPEPFGLVMIESLACGTPVLAHPVGSAPEVLKNGVTGFLDPNPETLAKSVRDLGTIRRQNCRSWVESRFSLERMTKDYIDVYRTLIQAYSTGHRRNIVPSLIGDPRRDSTDQLQG